MNYNNNKHLYKAPIILSDKALTSMDKFRAYCTERFTPVIKKLRISIIRFFVLSFHFLYILLSDFPNLITTLSLFPLQEIRNRAKGLSSGSLGSL